MHAVRYSQHCDRYENQSARIDHTGTSSRGGVRYAETVEFRTWGVYGCGLPKGDISRSSSTAGWVSLDAFRKHVVSASCLDGRFWLIADYPHTAVYPAVSPAAISGLCQAFLGFDQKKAAPTARPRSHKTPLQRRQPPRICPRWPPPQCPQLPQLKPRPIEMGGYQYGSAYSGAGA